MKSLLRRLKDISMVSEKLYRNTQDTRDQKGILEGGEAEKGIASYNIFVV